MRSGTVIAAAVALVVVVGGVVWYNDLTEPTPLDVEPEVAPSAEIVEEPISEEVAAPDAGDAIVVGDPIDDDTIVLESATDEPVILDADAAVSSVEMVDDDAPAAEVGIVEGAATDAGADTPSTAPEDAAATTDGTATPDGAATADGAAADDAATADDAADAGAAQADAEAPAADAAQLPAEELLTPANFDPAQVTVLLDEASELTAEQRSSLRALVEGAGNNPAMVDAALVSIRSALNLPPL